MDESKVREELESLGVIDNPFDVLVYQCMELCRNAVFVQRRYRGNELIGASGVTLRHLKYTLGKVTEEIETIASMSDESVALCKSASMKSGDNLDIINKTIFDLERNLETVYTRVNPCRDMEFECVRLGEDSDSYKRLVWLRDVSDKEEMLQGVTSAFLSKFIDYLDYPDKLEFMGITPELRHEYDTLQDMYNFKSEDISYVMAYKGLEH